MVDERTAYWGARDDARYRTRDDDPAGGDYVVAETLDANGDPVDVLLRWDDTAGEWVSGGPVNMNGEDVTNVGALDADSVSTATLNNDVVFVSPTDSLPNKITEVPNGGTLKFIGGDHDVSGYSLPITIDKLVNIEMVGGEIGNDRVGSWLVNTSINSPVLEFKASNNDFDSTPKVQDHRINVWHEGDTTPAVIYDDVRYTRTRPYIDLNNAGQDGIEYINGSFFANIIGGHIRRFTRRGVSDIGGGNLRVMWNPDLNGSSTDSDPDQVALYSGNANVTFGGQFAADVGIRDVGGGSAFYYPRFEGCTTGIKFGDGDTNTRAVGSYINSAHFVSISDYCVNFEYSRGCVVDKLSRLVNGSDTGEAIRWDDGSQRDGVISLYNPLSSKSVSVSASASSTPWIDIPQTLSNALISNLPTDSNLYVTVSASSTENAPVWHDGSSWQKSGTNSFTP